MGRARGEKREQAFKLWNESNGNIKLFEIARKLDVSDVMVRKWKCLDKWDSKTNKNIIVNQEVNMEKLKQVNFNKHPKQKYSLYKEVIISLINIIKDEEASSTDKLKACDLLYKYMSEKKIGTKLNKISRYVVINKVSDIEWDNAMKYFASETGETCCAYCGDKVSNPQKEHFIPFSLNDATSKINNIIPVCEYCNKLKNDKEFMEWYKTQPFYSENRILKIHEYLNINT